MSQSSQDTRDFANMQHFVARSSGMRHYAPAVNAMPNAIMCSCMRDHDTGIQSCACSPMMTSDMMFAPDQIGRGVSQTIRQSTPAERSEVKRRQRIIAQSIA
jgi:hypothetical protein